MSEQPTEKQIAILKKYNTDIPNTKAEAIKIIGKLFGDTESTEEKQTTETQTTLATASQPSPAQLKTDIQDCEDLYRIENNVKAFFANNNEPLVNEKIGLYVKLIWMGRHA